MSAPSNVTRPPASGTSRRDARPRVVLPLPDSPTTARVSPRATDTDTSWRMVTGTEPRKPWRARNVTLTWARSRIGSPAPGTTATGSGRDGSLAHGGTSSQHRAWWPGATSVSGGGSTHRSNTCGTAGREPAPRRCLERVWRRARQEGGHRIAVQPGHARQQAPGVRVTRRDQHIIGRTVLPDLARVHHHDAVAQVARERQVVGDEQHRDAPLPLELLEQVHDLGLDAHIQGAGRLVEDEQGRVVGERHGDHHPLAHATRQLVGVAPRRPGGQARPCPSRASTRAPCVAQTHAVRPQPLRHLVTDRDDRVERVHRALEHHGHAAPADLAPELLVRERRDVPALEPDAARRQAAFRGSRRMSAERQAGLAAARLPDDAHRLAAAPRWSATARPRPAPGRADPAYSTTRSPRPPAASCAAPQARLDDGLHGDGQEHERDRRDDDEQPG